MPSLYTRLILAKSNLHWFFFFHINKFKTFFIYLDRKWSHHLSVRKSSWLDSISKFTNMKWIHMLICWHLPFILWGGSENIALFWEILSNDSKCKLVLKCEALTQVCEGLFFFFRSLKMYFFNLTYTCHPCLKIWSGSVVKNKITTNTQPHRLCR